MGDGVAKRKYWANPPKNISPPIHEAEAWHRRDERAESVVYVFGTINGCCKIGKSASPYKRLRDLRSLPVELEMKAYILTGDAAWLENYLHTAFRDVRVKCEWFRLSEEDLAVLSPIQFAHSQSTIPKIIRLRHKRNLEAWRLSATRRQLRVDAERHATAGTKPVRTSIRKWMQLIRTGSLDAYCQQYGISPPSEVVRAIRGHLEVEAAMADGK